MERVCRGRMLCLKIASVGNCYCQSRAYTSSLEPDFTALGGDRMSLTPTATKTRLGQCRPGELHRVEPVMTVTHRIALDPKDRQETAVLHEESSRQIIPHQC